MCTDFCVGVCVCLQSDGAAEWKQALHSAQLVCGAVRCSTTSLVTSTAERRARLNSTRYQQTLQTRGQDVTQWRIIQKWVGVDCYMGSEKIAAVISTVEKIKGQGAEEKYCAWVERGSPANKINNILHWLTLFITDHFKWARPLDICGIDLIPFALITSILCQRSFQTRRKTDITLGCSANNLKNLTI